MDNELMFIIFAANKIAPMSPRSKTLRKILSPPVIKGFEPYGVEAGTQERPLVYLLFEEYEALRLCDYDLCTQRQASQLMCVSRPTFTRIYASALQKIASAFAEGRKIAVEGGKVYFDSDWYRCHGCECYFNNPENDDIESCPLCGSQQIVNTGFSREIVNGKMTKGYDLCICPHCGHVMAHRLGVPCNQQICPECRKPMKRKGSQGCRK